MMRCRWSENNSLDGKSGLGEAKKRVRCISVEKRHDRELPGLLK